MLFEVNLFGHVAVTQALLPALLLHSGRVINVSSVGGKIAMATYGTLRRHEVRAGGGQRRAAPGTDAAGRAGGGGRRARPSHALHRWSRRGFARPPVADPAGPEGRGCDT
ncbi:SDR family NAD(P)-dependent oxidoreductase [Microtetraspora malaysiensis]|uniref:SDR family NAD(P)-dependent oxidoreductase n=1 Tax=Microtetraspora malaysiensis TaxID=161358 RepID=UPI003D8FF286